MKKSIILLILGVLYVSSPLFAQPTCATDVWMSLDRKQIAKAVRLADECVNKNSTSADAWLMRANAYLQRYQEEEEKLERDAKYEVKEPDAIIKANESFLKAQEINPKVEARVGMFDPTRGRSLCALPLYYKAVDAFEAKKYERARDLFNASIKNFALERLTTQLKYNIGIFYSQLAETYTLLNDNINARQTIINGVKSGTSFPNIYLQLYDIYKTEGDTVNALKTIQTAKRNVPDSLALDIYTYELDYHADMGDFKKMNDIRDMIFEKYGMTISTIVRVVAYLNKSEQLESAEELILKGLAIDSLSFDLNQQMAFRHFSEALRLQEESRQAASERKYDEASINRLNSINRKKDAALLKAHDWAEKAYQINKNDRENNVMLDQLKKTLEKEIPEELKQKIESY